MSPLVLGSAVVYLLGTSLYSLLLNRILLADVFTLAALYLVRVFAGGLATGIPISYWTLGYTSFLFLSLALLKRYSELLLKVDAQSPKGVPGRAYLPEDAPIVAGIGLASGIAAAVLLALNLRSPEVQLLYTRPGVLMPLCAMHVYWISRVWIFAHRRKMDTDPIVFALRDHGTRKLGVAAGVCIGIAL